MLDLFNIRNIAPIMVFLQRVAEPHDTGVGPPRIRQRSYTDRLGALRRLQAAHEQRLQYAHGEKKETAPYDFSHRVQYCFERSPPEASP